MPDTSSLLNVLEVPVPDEKVSPNIVPAALAFLSRLRTNPPTLHIALAQVVEEEWLRNQKSKLEKSVNSIRRADERISFLWSIATSMNSAPVSPYLQFAGLQLAERLHAITESLLRSAKVIARDASFDADAGRRIAQGHAPASPARPEFNDCVLTEQYLALCRTLRASGLKERCVFVSSNVRDFGEPKAPRPPLDADFRLAGIDFAYDLAAAHALL